MRSQNVLFVGEEPGAGAGWESRGHGIPEPRRS